ncbi:MAG: hypothetical protein U0528_20490 [Anaerolineae bacterium]
MPSHFYPPDDPTNQPALRQAGIEVMLTENLTTSALRRAGFTSVHGVARCSAAADPTPTSVVLGGAKIDGFPLAKTSLDWLTLILT